MNEVKKSANNIEYISPKVLEMKSRVYSQAQLMRILHDHEDVVDIILKVGRYNKPFDEPYQAEPKSELTLSNQELNALISYINDNYAPLKLGEGRYISVDEKTEAQLLLKLKDAISEDPDKAKMLIESGLLNDNTLSVVTSIKRERELSVFCEMLNQDCSEKKWQSWFSKNKWMFGSDFAEIIDTRAIDTENISDYLTKAYDGYLDIVEIKKPNGIPFWSSTKDHNNVIPSSELIKAITQCLNYIYAIERESNSNKLYEKTNCKIIKPRCTLVIGRSNNWNEEQQKAYRILNSAYHQISILTYDHLLDRYKNITAS